MTKKRDDSKFYEEATASFNESLKKAPVPSGQGFPDEIRKQLKLMFKEKCRPRVEDTDLSLSLPVSRGFSEKLSSITSKVKKTFFAVVLLFSLAAAGLVSAVEVIDCEYAEGIMTCETGIGEQVQSMLYWLYVPQLLLGAFILLGVIVLVILAFLKR
jgi:hypothetical protein